MELSGRAIEGTAAHVLITESQDASVLVVGSRHLKDRAEAWLSESLARWREKYPGVEVSSSVLRDKPVPGLVAASNAQHLLVVRSRTRNALAGTLLGSVSQGVLHHATCPVAVIPADTD